MYWVTLSGVRFYAFHGVSLEEKVTGRQFSVDARVGVQGVCGKIDSLESTVDYGKLAELILQEGTGGPFKTLEFLARTLGGAIFNTFPCAQEVHLKVSKLHPPTGQTVESAGIELDLSRSEF